LKVKNYYIVGKAEPGNPLFLRMSEPERIKLSNILTEQVKSLLTSFVDPLCHDG